MYEMPFKHDINGFICLFWLVWICYLWNDICYEFAFFAKTQKDQLQI